MHRLHLRLGYPCRYRLRHLVNQLRGYIMIKHYGLAAASNMRPLNLPAMTLAQAEKSRDTLAAMGKSVHVINLKAE